MMYFRLESNEKELVARYFINRVTDLSSS